MSMIMDKKVSVQIDLIDVSKTNIHSIRFRSGDLNQVFNIQIFDNSKIYVMPWSGMPVEEYLTLALFIYMNNDFIIQKIKEYNHE